jgi:hypothetical protein
MPDRVAPIVGLAAHLGRGAQRIATDAVIGRARTLPRAIEALDAPYLSQIMGRTVTSVSVIGGDAGTSSRARLALTGDGLPDSVFVKMAGETIATRLMGKMGRLGQTETRFYGQLAPEPRHPASAEQGPGEPDRRTPRAPACDVLETTPPSRRRRAAWMALHRLGGQRRAAHRSAAEDIRAPNRREDRHPRRQGSLHRRQLPRRCAPYRRAAAHGHAR